MHFGKIWDLYRFRDSIWYYQQSLETYWKLFNRCFLVECRFLTFYQLSLCQLNFSIVLVQTFLRFMGETHGILGRLPDLWNLSPTSLQELQVIWYHIMEFAHLNHHVLMFQWCSSYCFLDFISVSSCCFSLDSRIFANFYSCSKWSQVTKRPFRGLPYLWHWFTCLLCNWFLF